MSWFSKKAEPPGRRELERMDERARTYLALGLTGLCWALLLGGQIWSQDAAWQLAGLWGYMLGGLASVPTLALCAYYLSVRRLRRTGMLIATGMSALYATSFVGLVGLLYFDQPLAAKLLTYAF